MCFPHHFSSRRYFFSLAIVAMAIMSSYYWAGWPYDNLCPVEGETANATYVGDWIVTPKESDPPVAITISDGEPVYEKCLQDFFRFPKDRSVAFHSYLRISWRAKNG